VEVLARRLVPVATTLKTTTKAISNADHYGVFTLLSDHLSSFLNSIPLIAELFVETT
jgi:hypothetical protein